MSSFRGEQGLDLAGDELQGAEEIESAAGGEQAQPSEVNAEQGEDGEGRDKGLGGRDANLRPGVHVNAAIGFTRDGAADDIDNGQGAVAAALGFAQGFADGGGERAGIGVLFAALGEMLADQMGKDLGVGAGMEGVSGFEQFFFEAIVVFDNAVMDDGDFAGLVEVRMGIFVGRRPVGGPTGVADAERAVNGLPVNERDEAFVDFAFFLADVEVGAVEDGEAGAVVAAVLEAAQAFEQDGAGGFFTYVANDAAHWDRKRCAT